MSVKNSGRNSTRYMLPLLGAELASSTENKESDAQAALPASNSAHLSTESASELPQPQLTPSFMQAFLKQADKRFSFK